MGVGNASLLSKIWESVDVVIPGGRGAVSRLRDRRNEEAKQIPRLLLTKGKVGGQLPKGIFELKVLAYGQQVIWITLAFDYDFYIDRRG